MMRYAAAVLMLLVMCGAMSAAEKPNIVLVMADDQGWGDMAYNGHPVLRTPNFDKMAREAVRFDRFYAAAPVCSPTRGSVMTGRTPNRYGVYQWGWALRPQEITLAEMLKPAGYRSGHFGKWHLGSVQAASTSNPGAQGFDEWVSAPNYYDLDPILSDRGKATPFKGDSSDIAAELAIRFMRDCAAKKQPFLAVVWFGSPHAPHEALESDRALYPNVKGGRDFYAEITAMDRAFGRIREELKTLGVRDNTVLWYCSDNGALPKVGSAGNRRENKGSIYEGGLAVPGLLEWPARLPKARVIDTPCVTSDIFPTVLAITGVAAPGGRTLDGVNLLPILTGQSTQRDQAIGFWNAPIRGVSASSKVWMKELYDDQQAGREPNDPGRVFADAAKVTARREIEERLGHAAWLDGTWKLHRIAAKDGSGVKWELYDLRSDPKEAKDLSAEQPQRLARMKQQLDDWMTSVIESHNGAEYAPQ